MRNKVYWGLGILMILLIATTTVVVIRSNNETQRLRDELAELEAQKKAEKTPHAVDFSKTKPPDVPGFVWVRHGDHWDKVPIDAPDTGQGESHGEVGTEDNKPIQTYHGALTYHAELLETNPVRALRLQTIERGHWSAEWIPPFPPDDTEAQDFARVSYLRQYYMQNYGYEKLGTPEYEKETKVYREARGLRRQMRDTIFSYPYGARRSDLMKLMWPGQETPISVWGDGTVDPSPSEYFGDAEARERLKQLGMWDY